jgi:hypothetical protein
MIRRVLIRHDPKDGQQAFQDRKKAAYLFLSGQTPSNRVRRWRTGRWQPTTHSAASGAVSRAVNIDAASVVAADDSFDGIRCRKWMAKEPEHDRPHLLGFGLADRVNDE